MSAAHGLKSLQPALTRGDRWGSVPRTVDAWRRVEDEELKDHARQLQESSGEATIHAAGSARPSERVPASCGELRRVPSDGGEASQYVRGSFAPPAVTDSLNQKSAAPTAWQVEERRM